MRLAHDPFPLIFAQGDDVTQLVCLEFFGLGDSPQAESSLVKVLKRQRFDGAFPSQFGAESWGMLETVRHTLLLLKAGLPPGGSNVASAVGFILSQQRADGGWSENPALELPPERTWLSQARSITWLTADVVDLLHQVGMGDGHGCQAAVRWLRSVQNRWGGWPSLAVDADDEESDTGDPDASAQITFLIGDLYGEDDRAYLRGKELFERHLDDCARDAARGYWIKRLDGSKTALDAYTLTHLLLSWLLDPPRHFQCGYDVSDPRVKRMMEALVDIQRDDGGWRPFWTQESDPVYTVLAVKALILSGILAREELEADVKAYAG